MFVFKVYARVDDKWRVLEVGSSAFIRDLDGWVEIDQGAGDRYQHAQANYLTSPLFDMRGICRYKLIDGTLVERTEAEMDADVKPAEKPEFVSRLERVETALNTITEMIKKLGVK